MGFQPGTVTLVTVTIIMSQDDQGLRPPAPTGAGDGGRDSEGDRAAAGFAAGGAARAADICVRSLARRQAGLPATSGSESPARICHRAAGGSESSFAAPQE